MTDKEAMKLALEALENSVDMVSNEAREAEKMYANVPTRLKRVQGLIAIEVAHEKAIAALKERLLEAPMREVQRLGQEIEQEPVAWMWDVNNGGGYTSRGVGLYQTDIPFAKHTPLYAHTPQRTWVGLTSKEQLDIFAQSVAKKRSDYEHYKAIEQALKDKNT